MDDYRVFWSWNTHLIRGLAPDIYSGLEIPGRELLVGWYTK
jgi:hypothetical protein